MTATRRASRASRARILLAALVALGSIWLTRLAAPELARACSCMPTGPADIAEAGNFDGGVVFVGLVTAMEPGAGNEFGHRFGEMRIERLFKGTMPATVRVMGGGGGDCTMHLEVGQHMLTVGSYIGNVLTPGLCNPYADPNTPEGQALLAAAVEAYGPGIVPDQPTGGGGLDDLPDDPGPAGFVLGMVGILVLMVFIAVVVSFRQRREEPPA